MPCSESFPSSTFETPTAVGHDTRSLKHCSSTPLHYPLSRWSFWRRHTHWYLGNRRRMDATSDGCDCARHDTLLLHGRCRVGRHASNHHGAESHDRTATLRGSRGHTRRGCSRRSSVLSAEGNSGYSDAKEQHPILHFSGTLGTRICRHPSPWLGGGALRLA